jgi:hypothetical protein
MFLAAAVGAGGLAGCGADVPQHPTWQGDVYPILVARCTRCHNANKTSDPESLPGISVLGNFDYASFDDLSTGDAAAFVLLAAKYVQASTPPTQMPPAPAAKLADWQIETIKRFVADHAPTP